VREEFRWLSWYSACPYWLWSPSSLQCNWYRTFLPSKIRQFWSAADPHSQHRVPTFKMKVHYRADQCPPPVLILSQINAVHVTPSYFIMIHFTLILLSTSKLSKLSLSYMFPHQNLVCIPLLLHTCHMLRPSRPPWFDDQNNLVPLCFKSREQQHGYQAAGSCWLHRTGHLNLCR